MKFLIISNTKFISRPHLVRLSRLIAYWNYKVLFCEINDKIQKKEKNINFLSINKISGRIGLILNLICQFFSLLKVIKNYSSSDILIATHPYSLLLMFLVKIFNQKIKTVYYPGEIYDGKGLWHLRFIEKICIKIVKGYILPNKPREEYLINNYGFKPSYVIPNSTPDFQIYSNYKIKKPVGKIKLIYLGTSNVRRRCLDNLINAVDLYESDLLLSLAVGGREEEINKIKEIIRNAKNPDRFKFLDYAPYPNHFKYMKDAHIGVMLYHPNISLNYKYCEPNKIYEYAMMSLPVLSSDQTHLKSSVESYDFGVAVDPLDVKNIIEGINELLGKDLDQMRINARDWFIEKGNYNKQTEKLRDWFYEITK